MTQESLFDVPAPEPVERLSADARRTRRQQTLIASGFHPLTAVTSYPLPLHPDADRAATREEPGTGPHCGTCLHRVLVRWQGHTYAKCAYGIGPSGTPLDAAPRASHGGATDCRAWWPGCVDHQPAVTFLLHGFNHLVHAAVKPPAPRGDRSPGWLLGATPVLCGQVVQRHVGGEDRGGQYITRFPAAALCPACAALLSASERAHDVPRPGEPWPPVRLSPVAEPEQTTEAEPAARAPGGTT